MAASFIPTSGSLLFRTPEDQATQATISTDMDTVNSWTWNVIDGDGIFEIVDNGDNLTVKYNGDKAPFPFTKIGYVDSDTQENFLPSGSTLEDLPPSDEAVNIFVVERDGSGTKDWTIEVTAEGEVINQETGLPESETINGTFTITIEANYSTAKNKLQELVDARN